MSILQRENYFDNAASTPIDPRVLEAMMPWLQDGYGNPHSIHEPGRHAHDAVEQARVQVAALLGSEPEEVVFTSGATESNNWVMKDFARYRAAISPFEHSSVLEPAESLGLGLLEFRGYGPKPGQSIEAASVMLVNNETGVVLDPTGVQASKCLHSDITQALGKIPFSLDGIDLASFSAHKLHGPKGIGGLFARGGLAPTPLLLGGGQEEGRRAGTLNVAGIVGFGAAAALAREVREKDHGSAATMRSIVLDELGTMDDMAVNSGSPNSPFILSLSFAHLEGEILVIDLDRAGFAISSGAACSSGSNEPSHVLSALGMEPEWIRGTVRISFGRFNTPESARRLGMALRSAVQKTRRFH